MSKKTQPQFIEIEKTSDKKVKRYGPPKSKFIAKGAELFGDTETNRFAICGPSGKGKTNLTCNIIKKIQGNKTAIFLFSSTGKVDPVIKDLINKIPDGEERTEIYESPIVKEGRNKIDLVGECVGEFDEEEFLDSKKRRIPKGIVIYDDLPNDLKDAVINNSFKTMRHHRCTVIANFHDLTDLRKDTRQEITIGCFFKGFSKERFCTFIEQWGVELDPEIAYFVYCSFLKKITDFLLIKKNGEMRINFNKKITLG